MSSLSIKRDVADLISQLRQRNRWSLVAAAVRLEGEHRPAALRHAAFTMMHLYIAEAADSLVRGGFPITLQLRATDFVVGLERLIDGRRIYRKATIAFWLDATEINLTFDGSGLGTDRVPWAPPNTHDDDALADAVWGASLETLRFVTGLIDTPKL